METYSGMWADKLRLRDIVGFLWSQRWELLSFLFWTGRVQREARHRS